MSASIHWTRISYRAKTTCLAYQKHTCFTSRQIHKWMTTKINYILKIKIQKFQTAGNRQCRQMNCLTADISNKVIGQYTLFSPWRHCQSHCNLVPRKLDPVTFNFGYMVKTALTTRLSQCWINELQSFLPRKRLIPESLGMKKPAFGKWFRNPTLLNSLRKSYMPMLYP